MALRNMKDGCLECAQNEFRNGEHDQKEMLFTGYKDIDKMLGGMLPGELYLIGARPAMGKSIFTYNLINRMCVRGSIETLLISTESPAESVLRIMLAIMTGNEYQYPRPNELTEKEGEGVDDAVKQLRMSPFLIEDSVYQTLDMIKKTCRKVKRKHPIKVVIIDSWEGIKMPMALNDEDGDEQRTKEQSTEEAKRILIDVLHEFKQIAKELSVVIIVNKKLSRDIEEREDHFPRAYDFSLPAEAMDVATGILTLYRYSYYYYDPDDERDLIISAYRTRNRGEDMRRLLWNPWKLQFMDEFETNDGHKEYCEEVDEEEILYYPASSASGQKMYPVIEKANMLLREICIKGINTKYEGELKKTAFERIKKELRFVRQQGSASGYLTLLNDLNAVGAKPEEFYCPGTIASSLLAYVIGISNVEPMNSKPRLYPEFYYGIDGEKEPYFEVRVTPCLQERLRDYYADYPRKGPVTSIYGSWKRLKIVYGEDLLNADSMRDLDDRFSISYPMIRKDSIQIIDPKDEQILRICGPETSEEYVKCYGLMHGTGVWENVENMIAETGALSYSEMLANREDVYEFLLEHNIDDRTAYEITENVRKGKIHSNGWPEEMLVAMDKVNIPDWFIQSCRNIQYLFPRAHAMTLFNRYGMQEWNKEEEQYGSSYDG